MAEQERCRNLNHSKTNVTIRFCTECGEVLNSSIRNSCDEAKHASRRKDRSKFCGDCGKNLRQ